MHYSRATGALGLTDFAGRFGGPYYQLEGLAAGGAVPLDSGMSADSGGGCNPAPGAGKSRPAGPAVGLDGQMLGLELTGPGFDYRQWFRELVDQLGVEVVVTDYAVEYAGTIEDAGLEGTPETGLAESLERTAGPNVPVGAGVAGGRSGCTIGPAI